MPATTTPGLTAYTLTKTYVHVRVNANAANFTITLPAASGVKGHELTILKTDASSHTVTLAVASGSGDALNVPPGANVISAPWKAVRLRSTGTAWEIAC